MTYDQYASKRFGAKEIWLVEISTAFLTERFCSGLIKSYTTGLDVPEAGYAASTVWNRGAVIRGDLQLNDNGQSSIDFILPHSSVAASNALISSAEQEISVKLFHGYSNDPDDEFIIFFQGSVIKVFPRWNGIKLACVDLSSLFSTKIPGRVIQRDICPYALFSPGCGLVKTDFEDIHSLTVINDSQVTIPTADDTSSNFYEKGLLEYNGEIKLITSQVNEVLTLSSPLSTTDSPPFNVKLTRACFKRKTDCLSFNNKLNFGAFEQLNDSPYDGRSIG